MFPTAAILSVFEPMAQFHFDSLYVNTLGVAERWEDISGNGHHVTFLEDDDDRAVGMMNHRNRHAYARVCVCARARVRV